MNKLHALSLVVLLAAPVRAQQLLAWPIGMPNPIRVQPVPLPPTKPILRPTPAPTPTPTPTPPVPTPAPAPVQLELTGYSVEGRVNDMAADLTYHITFHNPTNRRLEGELVMPIPPDTALSGFQMTMGGKMVKGEVLESEQARTVYENIVRSMRDPGLLELMGERMIRARVFPIEANGQITIRMDVAQLLRRSGDLASLRVPLRSARMGGGATKGEASVSIDLRTTEPLRALYSPLPGARITRLDDRRAKITYKQGEEDLNLFWSTQKDPLAAGLLAYREPGEDGFFMLSLSPKPMDASERASIPKDLVFVVDRSGSMEDGGKMQQARDALSYVVSRLGPSDRFGIVDFATGVDAFESTLLAATPENKKRALAYIKALEAAGGTNIEGGLRQGLELLKPQAGRVPMLFFMTDGLPTVGATDVDAILRAAAEKNAALRARVFTFGVGADVNTLLLDKLASGNRGAGDYVAPDENIEAKVSSLYLKVAKPAMTDVKLSWEGVDVAQVYPKPIEDLFHGSELIVMGRYKSAGKGKLKVTSSAGAFEFPVEFPKEAASHAFVPKLWAGKRIGHELDAIRLSGRPADPEVVKDIVKLAKKHGIVTPFTSYLITEEGTNLAAASGAATQAFETMRFDAANSGRGGGFAAQRHSKALAAVRGAIGGGAAAAAPMLAMADADMEVRQELQASGRKIAETRTIGGKTFYKRGDTWVDGDLELSEGHAEVRLAPLSKEYFDLLRSKPGLAKWLSVGEKVKLLDGETAYIIE